MGIFILLNEFNEGNCLTEIDIKNIKFGSDISIKSKKYMKYHRVNCLNYYNEIYTYIIYKIIMLNLKPDEDEVEHMFRYIHYNTRYKK